MTNRALLAVAAPVASVLFGLVVCAVILVASGHDPLTVYSNMLTFGTQTDSLISAVNRAVPLFIAGLAVAIGFKMNVFNIGVEGQYALAALVAAAAGAAVVLPAPLHIAFILVVAMATGALWSGIAAALKVTRGVHEVLSTLMLNYVATGLGAFLFANYLRSDGNGEAAAIATRPLPDSARLPSLNGVLSALGIAVPAGSELGSFLLIAAVLGVAYYVLLWRTRFGYDLRAVGLNPFAARASGVDSKAMIVRTMLLSGAIAGLIGLPDLLGYFGRYNLDFPAGLGFTGIAVALLGRNHPVGIALGALLFGFLGRSAQILDLNGIPKEIADIMQGTIILSVVVGYEVVSRLVRAQEARRAAGAARRRPPAGSDRAPGPGHDALAEVAR
jgi:general nucleoside transport system permease protein